MSPSGGFSSLLFDQAVPKNSQLQRHLADQKAICILHQSDCVWLCCLLSQLKKIMNGSIILLAFEEFCGQLFTSWFWLAFVSRILNLLFDDFIIYSSSILIPKVDEILAFFVKASMTSLLMHTVAHSTRPSFRLKTNNQPLKKFLSLAVSWVKVVKNGKILTFKVNFLCQKLSESF